MPFLPPYQQRQSTEGKIKALKAKIQALKGRNALWLNYNTGNSQSNISVVCYFTLTDGEHFVSLSNIIFFTF